MREDIEIKTHDQTTLRGWFYPAGAKAPALVMSAGVGFPLGITILINGTLTLRCCSSPEQRTAF